MAYCVCEVSQVSQVSPYFPCPKWHDSSFRLGRPPSSERVKLHVVTVFLQLQEHPYMIQTRFYIFWKSFRCYLPSKRTSEGERSFHSFDLGLWHAMVAPRCTLLAPDGTGYRAVLFSLLVGPAYITWILGLHFTLANRCHSN